MAFEVLIERWLDLVYLSVDQIVRIVSPTKERSFLRPIVQFSKYQILPIKDEVLTVEVEFSVPEQEPFSEHPRVCNVNERPIIELNLVLPITIPSARVQTCDFYFRLNESVTLEPSTLEEIGCNGWVMANLLQVYVTAVDGCLIGLSKNRVEWLLASSGDSCRSHSHVEDNKLLHSLERVGVSIRLEK